jgi:hypothetical protein
MCSNTLILFTRQDIVLHKASLIYQMNRTNYWSSLEVSKSHIRTTSDLLNTYLLYMRYILYEHKYCGFFLAKRIFGYRDEERVQYSSHKGIFEYPDEENPHTSAFGHPCIHAFMHVHCPGPCRKSMLHVHVHAACPCPCCIPCQCCILCQCFMSMSISMYIYVEMPKCRIVRHPISPVPDWKKTNDAGTGPVPD